MEDHVVAAEVAVDDPRLVLAGGDVAGQPVDQPVHRGDPAGLDVAEILFRPAADLALEIIARLAIVAEADRLRIEAVELGDRRVHRVEIGGSVGRVRLGKARLPDDPPLHHGHYVKGGADDALILAQGERFGDREALTTECGDHPIFAIHGMGAREQLAGRLAPQHIGAVRRDQLVGGVGLPPLELLDAQRAREALHLPLHPLFQPSYVEPVRFANVRGAAVLGASVHRLDSSFPALSASG